MKRTLKRGLKVFEIAERKVKGTSVATEIDACVSACCFLVHLSTAAHLCGKLECIMFSCWKTFVLAVAHLCAVCVDKMVLFNPS
jgi:hypothetical protein